MSYTGTPENNGQGTRGPAIGAHRAPETGFVRRRLSPALGGFMALMAMLVSLCAPAEAASPLAGTYIDNTALLSYTGSATPTASNSIRVIIQGVESFTLANNRQITAIPGSLATLYHTLTNTGNVTSTYMLTLANLSGDGYDINALTLYRTIGTTGTLAPTDPVIPPGGVITLNLGESAILVITGIVPANTTQGQNANIQISAASTSAGGTAANTDSILTLAPVPPTIDYYTDDSYSRKAVASAIGSPLFVQANAPQCNVDPLTVETKTVTLVSALSGDLETYPAVETGPNTGIFRIVPNVPTRDAATNPAIHGNGIVEELRNDVITASIQGCGSASVATQLYIDPMGIVFDSHSNTLIAGAQVTLIDVTGTGNGGNPGGPARVLAVDGVTPAPATVITGADGAFQFPLVAAGTYLVKIVPPNGYKFPSVVPLAQLPANRTIDPSGSYGNPFAVSSATGTVRFDAPLDPGPLGGLFVEKAASIKIAEMGDFVDYTITIKNLTGKPLADVTLTDILPSGFSYQTGSARLDGKLLADPAGGRGPLLVFTLGNIDSDKLLTLTYRVKIGPGAFEGTGINYAQAKAPNGTVSNVATARVQIQGGVFSEKGFIIGKVFTDCNRNRIHDPRELGIPGVRLYLEDGTFVITDSEGKYSLYNISPRTHVLKIDATTLPPASELITLSNRNGGDAGSLFIDMKNGGMHKANFAEGSCNAEVMKEVKERRAKGQVIAAEIDRNLAKPLAFETMPASQSDVRGLPSSGLIGGANPPAAVAPAQSDKSAPQPATATAKTTGPAAQPQPPAPELEDILTGADKSIDFLNLKDKDILPTAQTPIRIKGPAGGSLQLLVNGTEVSEKQMGKKIVDSERQLEAREYIAIDLKSGVNKLQIFLVDPFGNRRGEKTIQVTAPGKLSKITISVPVNKFFADGRTAMPVRVSLTDENGAPFKGKMILTLESCLGRWEATDIDEKEPGTQVMVVGGSAEYLLRPPAEPGEALIKISSGTVKAATKVYFYPDLRPMIATGLVEGTINLRNLGSSFLAPARNQDGFEQELTAYSFSTDNGKQQGGARAALFLKGKIKGDCLLTVAYDSDKDTREALFRDIQPDQFYPVYGDSAVKGFEAQSTGKLYVRIDKDKSYLLYGDYITPAAPDVRVLGAYNRSLNGFRGHYEDSVVTANAFASRDSSRQVVNEQDAKGISGPYFLIESGFIPNSEKVEIITRDRNQHSLVLKSVPQTRFSDYEIDDLSGRILFKTPVPTLDLNSNPISIRVTYETDQGGDKFWVAGADAQVKLHKNWEVGAAYVRDENPVDKYELKSANTMIKLFEKTYLIGEWAQSFRESVGRGDAERLELRHESEKLQAKVYGVLTDRNFDNQSSTYSKGRKEAGAKLAYKATPTTTITAEALYSEDMQTGGKRDGMMVNIQQIITKNLKAEFGVRHSHETTAPSQASGPAVPAVTPNDVTTLRTSLTGKLPQLPKLSITGEYEQSLNYSDRRIAAGSFEYQLSSVGKLYARHEFISSLAGPYNLNSTQQQNTTQVGVDTEYMKDGKLFSEYRVRDAIAGREAEAAIGLKNSWQIAKGIRLNTTLERIQKLDGKTDNTATAVTGAVEYTASPLWKGTARLEVRTSTTNNIYLNTLGVAYKVNRNITLLGKQFLSYTDNRNAGDVIQERLQAGFAYRPTDTDTWNVLSRYEFKYENNGSGANAILNMAQNRAVHIISTHLNYQPTNSLTFSARYAGKLVLEDSNKLANTSVTQMLSGRAIYDLTSKWDVGLNYSALFSDLFKSCRYGVGGEVGYMVATNLWLTGGYNIFGFKDKDLTAEEYTAQGVYFRIRFKFDEDLFSGNDPKVNKTLPMTEIARAYR